MRNPFKLLSKVNPQREDGTRQIENSVFQHLIAAGLPGPEYQAVLLIIDMTWGWGKTEDMIALSQFVEATHLDRRYIFRILDSLERRRMIIVQRTKTGGRGRSNTYMFNKYHDTWLTPNSQKPAPEKSDVESPLQETATGGHSSASKSDGVSLIEKGDGESLSGAGKSDKIAGKSDSHAQGKSDSQSPTKERSKESIQRNNIYKDNLMKEISKLYSENIGVIKPALAEEMREFCESFGGLVAWIKPAFKDALSRNKKSWGYVRTILENWEEKGGPDDGKGKSTSATHRPGTRGHTAKEFRDSLRRGKPA